MNFLDLLNQVARVAKPAHTSFTSLTSMDVQFKDTDIDSLDGLLILMYMCMIYDISDSVAKEFHPATPQELYDFIEAHKTRDPESIESALEMIK
jgi:hypothetical protein